MSIKKPIRVIQFGLGAIGSATALLVKKKPSLRLVGAIESDESNRRATALGVPVVASVQALLRRTRADIVLHTTGSSMAKVTPQILEVVDAGLPCVSTSEELFFPNERNQRFAGQLDRAARLNHVVVTGTGVNPGFVMDVLPVILSSTCHRIRRIEIKRIVDVSTRRIQLQRKVGVGLRPSEFNQLRLEGRIGHIGLRESALFVAKMLGWKLDSVQQTLSSVRGKNRIEGIHEFVRGKRENRVVLTMELKMAVHARDPRDEIIIDGDPPLRVVIPGGIRGDQATAAILVNTIPLALRAQPGLRSVVDLGMPRILA